MSLSLNERIETLIIVQLIHCQAMIAYDILSFNLHALNAELGPNFFAETSSDTKA